MGNFAAATVLAATILLASIVLSAIVPTAIAQRFFEPGSDRGDRLELRAGRVIPGQEVEEH